MRTAPLVGVALVLAACRIETAASGRPPGPPTPADSLARLEEDPAARVEVEAALRTYYRRFSSRDWRGFSQSFWPGAVISTRWTPPGAPAPRVEMQSLEEFIRRAREQPGRPAVFSEAPVHLHVRSYGDLADAWVIYRARLGRTRDSVAVYYGVDAFQLLRHDGDWRILSLAFTQEVAGRPLEALR